MRAVSVITMPEWEDRREGLGAAGDSDWAMAASPLDTLHGIRHWTLHCHCTLENLLSFVNSIFSSLLDLVDFCIILPQQGHIFPSSFEAFFPLPCVVSNEERVAWPARVTVTGWETQCYLATSSSSPRVSVVSDKDDGGAGARDWLPPNSSAKPAPLRPSSHCEGGRDWKEWLTEEGLLLCAGDHRGHTSPGPGSCCSGRREWAGQRDQWLSVRQLCRAPGIHHSASKRQEIRDKLSNAHFIQASDT